MTTKRTSGLRFQHINLLTSRVFPAMAENLTSHRLVVVLCWRCANTTAGFNISMVTLSDMTGLTARRCRAIMRDLEKWNVIIRDPDRDHYKAQAWTFNILAGAGGEAVLRNGKKPSFPLSKKAMQKKAEAQTRKGRSPGA